MPDNRYAERGDTFLLETYGKGGKTTLSGRTEDAPEWLANIVTVAKVGGYLKEVDVGPPDRILWFITNDNGDLVRLTDFID